MNDIDKLVSQYEMAMVSNDAGLATATLDTAQDLGIINFPRIARQVEISLGDIAYER